MCRLFITSVVYMITLHGHALAVEQADKAQQLYSQYEPSILQIRVVETATGNKTAIGSGFIISREGHIATNFHVISNKIHHPARYRLEYVSTQGSTGALTIADIDVIHDLAVLKSELRDKEHLRLGKASLTKGTQIYSLGNPHDLGLSVVEGTYNGLLEHALYDKIFFSGSLNPGMSGGPTLDKNGRVVGINVSTAGNQVSFLVPVHYLQTLYDNVLVSDADISDYKKRIEEQLLAHQNSYIKKILGKEWKTTQLGQYQLPQAIDDIIKCWGDSDNDTEALVDHAYSNCFSEDRIFLAPQFSTGGIAYSYDIYTKRNISTLHFYNLYSREFGRDMRLNSAGKEDVTNYECNSNFVVDANNKDWKIAFCARRYREYPALFDVMLAIASVGDNAHGLIIQLAMAGIDKSLAIEFVRRFIKEIQWQKS